MNTLNSLSISHPTPFNSPFILKTSELVRKVAKVSIKHFGAVQGIGMALYGVKEILCDRVSAIQENPTLPPFKRFVNQFFLERDEKWGCLGFHMLHGVLYTGSGINHALASFPTLLRGTIQNTTNALGTSLFFIANIFSLEYFVDAYLEASKINLNDPQFMQEAAHRIKHSSVIGILNTLSYLLVSAVTLFGGPVALAFVFGCIAITTGSLKIVYDFLYLG